MARWIALGACCVAILLSASATRADLPQRALVGNFIGYDALPENYFSISGSVDRTQNGESLYLEKTISPDSSFSLFAGYQRLEQEGETTVGFDAYLRFKRVEAEKVVGLSPAELCARYAEVY